MIDLWQLPGPLRAARQIVAHLERGMQVSFRAEPDWERGFRLAVEQELNQQQFALTVIFDDDAPPASLIAEATGSAARAPDGLFWVANIAIHRAASWQREIERISDSQRDRPLRERLQLVLALPVTPDGRAAPGHEAMRERIVLLSRLDLEVMARYRLAQRTDPPALLAIVAEIAIALTLPMMEERGCDALIDLLDSWLGMPLDCIGDAGRLAAFAAGRDLPAGDPITLHLVIWRAQQSVLMAEIDARRLALIEEAANWCFTPYTHEVPGTARMETVEERRLLQVGHLARQAQLIELQRSDPAVGRLGRLKTARDDLSHLKPLPIYRIKELLQMRCGDFSLG
ncbi:MAG TPA: hypothetical protein VNS22_13855 [Geminicoccus sp.]|uniref:hypothetical protein n=1 Tax=Geminicoccus sp. TaxID=2024832 RepID=UPI002D1C9EB7|nr:hypothetical protein [Geminicoccus sp.]HWL69452.1 hypothetical protein [Geminicoccus sp.]